MVESIAVGVGLAWNGAILLLLRRLQVPVISLVVAFYLLSAYPADHLVPQVLVDYWPNFDGSAAMRPWVVLPDLLLAAVVIRQARHLRGFTMACVAGLAATGLIALIVGLRQDPIPNTAALYWLTAPLRAIGVVLLLDLSVRTLGWAGTARSLLVVFAVAAIALSIEILAVSGLQRLAAAADLDLTTLWPGFALDRPNLPGWNNNVVASAIALGSASLLVAPRSLRPAPRLVVGTVSVSAVALLATEYRTGIIVLAFALSLAGSLRLLELLAGRPRLALASILATGFGVAAFVVLLTISSLAVPRLNSLSPIAFVASLVPGEGSGSGGEPGDPSTESRTDLIRAAVDVWLRQPVTGPGLGAWEFTRPIEPSFLQRAITPHNGVAWALADLGLIGLTALYVIPFGLAIRTLRSLPLVLVGMVALMEMSTVGIAQARYSVMIWAVIWLMALSTRSDETRLRSPRENSGRHEPPANEAGRTSEAQPSAGSPR